MICNSVCTQLGNKHGNRKVTHLNFRFALSLLRVRLLLYSITRFRCSDRQIIIFVEVNVNSLNSTVLSLIKMLDNY